MIEYGQHKNWGGEMVWLWFLGIEWVSAIIFVIPAVVVLRCAVLKQRGLGKSLPAFFFAAYVAAVFAVVGIPSVDSLTLDLTLNFIPLVDSFGSLSALRNAILNIVLFFPMGFLLPLIWEEWRAAKKVVLMGFAVSVCVELSQIFTFRATDIDDLVTNTLGALAGYWVWKKVSHRLSKSREAVSAETALSSPCAESDPSLTCVNMEPILILMAVYLITVFLKPLVSNVLWEVVLSGFSW